METKDWRCASHLEGKKLNGKWTVIKKIEKDNDNNTGGNFSIGYIVEDGTGKKAFLKAMDILSVVAGPSMIDTLKELVDAHKFEVDLLKKCVGSNLKYVVRILDSGEYMEPSFASSVPFIIFECAEASARQCLDFSRKMDFAWSLRSLHNVAVALKELHQIDIAHQDIKPSNIMLFENKQKSKLGDVGRSSLLGTKALHDDLNVSGDLIYSPFEQIYGCIDNDWKIRRYSCDMYMFGNLIYTYFNGISLTITVLKRLERKYLPYELRGTYQGTYQEILDLLVTTFDQVLEEFNKNVDERLRNELVTLVKQLCHPDYQKFRGDLYKQGSQKYSMERFISKLDMLSSKYEYSLRKGVVF